jgi:hypothetical protein
MNKGVKILLSKYHSGSQVTKTERGMECSTYGGSRGTHRVLVGKPEGMKQLGRARRRWEDNSKMDLREMEWGPRTESIWLKIQRRGGLL